MNRQTTLRKSCISIYGNLKKPRFALVIEWISEIWQGLNEHEIVLTTEKPPISNKTRLSYLASIPQEEREKHLFDFSSYIPMRKLINRQKQKINQLDKKTSARHKPL